MRDWAELILRVGREQGHWPATARSSRRRRATGPGASEVMALRVGYEKLNRETGWEPQVSWEEGVAATIALVRREPRRAGSAGSTGSSTAHDRRGRRA